MNSDSSTKATVLESLVESYTDSDEESGPQAQRTETPLSAECKAPSIESSSLSGAALVSYAVEDDDAMAGGDDSMDDRSEQLAEGESTQAAPVRPESPVSFHRRLQNLPLNEIVLPPEPPGRCAPALQQKIARLYEHKVRSGLDMNASIQMRKNFRNPSMYEKLVSFCGIDELGTNYPPEKYDPSIWGPESHYEELSRRQKEEMEKRQREKKNKAEPVRGIVKGLKPTKSKWDVVGTMPIQGMPGPVTTATLGLTLAGTSKSAVISAADTLNKKPTAVKRP